MKHAAALLILLCFIAGCNKNKTVQCTERVIRVPCYVCLGGFLKSDADTFIFSEYVKGSNFTQLIKSDTTSVPYTGNAMDTLSNQAVFASITDAKDYQLELPGIMRAYRITHVSYHGATTYTYTTEGGCRGRGFYDAPDSALVNGQPVNMLTNGAPSYLFLHK